MTSENIFDGTVANGIFDNITKAVDNFNKTFDNLDITDVKISTAFDTTTKLAKIFKEVFRLTVWQHTVKYSVNSAKICLN